MTSGRCEPMVGGSIGMDNNGSQSGNEMDTKQATSSQIRSSAARRKQATVRFELADDHHSSSSTASLQSDREPPTDQPTNQATESPEQKPGSRQSADEEVERRLLSQMQQNQQRRQAAQAQQAAGEEWRSWPDHHQQQEEEEQPPEVPVRRSSQTALRQPPLGRAQYSVVQRPPRGPPTVRPSQPPPPPPPPMHAPRATQIPKLKQRRAESPHFCIEGAVFRPAPPPPPPSRSQSQPPRNIWSPSSSSLDSDLDELAASPSIESTGPIEHQEPLDSATPSPQSTVIERQQSAALGRLPEATTPMELAEEPREKEASADGAMVALERSQPAVQAPGKGWRSYSVSLHQPAEQRSKSLRLGRQASGLKQPMGLKMEPPGSERKRGPEGRSYSIATSTLVHGGQQVAPASPIAEPLRDEAVRFWTLPGKLKGDERQTSDDWQASGRRPLVAVPISEATEQRGDSSASNGIGSQASTSLAYGSADPNSNTEASALEPAAELGDAHDQQTDNNRKSDDNVNNTINNDMEIAIDEGQLHCDGQQQQQQQQRHQTLVSEASRIVIRESVEQTSQKLSPEPSIQQHHCNRPSEVQDEPSGSMAGPRSISNRSHGSGSLKDEWFKQMYKQMHKSLGKQTPVNRMLQAINQQPDSALQQANKLSLKSQPNDQSSSFCSDDDFSLRAEACSYQPSLQSIGAHDRNLELYYKLIDHIDRVFSSVLPEVNSRSTNTLHNTRRKRRSKRKLYTRSRSGPQSPVSSLGRGHGIVGGDHDKKCVFNQLVREQPPIAKRYQLDHQYNPRGSTSDLDLELELEEEQRKQYVAVQQGQDIPLRGLRKPAPVPNPYKASTLGSVSHTTVSSLLNKQPGNFSSLRHHHQDSYRVSQHKQQKQQQQSRTNQDHRVGDQLQLEELYKDFDELYASMTEESAPKLEATNELSEFEEALRRIQVSSVTAGASNLEPIPLGMDRYSPQTSTRADSRSTNVSIQMSGPALVEEMTISDLEEEISFSLMNAKEQASALRKSSLMSRRNRNPLPAGLSLQYSPTEGSVPIGGPRTRAAYDLLGGRQPTGNMEGRYS